MKFGKLILRKIIIIFATRCLILGLKCTKNRFRLGLCHRPRWGSLQRSADPLAGFWGPTSKGRGGETRGGEMTGREGKRTTAIPNFLDPERSNLHSKSTRFYF